MSKALLEKIKKNTTIKQTEVLTKSKIYGHKSETKTDVPMINVALSGRVDGGMSSGLTVIAGPSKHFKSSFMLLLASAFLRANPDGLVLFYDSEFGTPASYVKNFDVDPEKVVHTPITNIEELKFDIMSQLDGFERSDKIMIIIDSIGNLASKKEVEDALKENSAADMTRARSIKSLFRIVTPHLTLKDIPMVVVNHTYQTQEMYSKAVVSGGTGIYYSADNIWIVGRQQDKNKSTNEIEGYDFVINVDKSRFLKEKSKIPISISYEKGINKWSGLLELALEGQYVGKPKNGEYQAVDRSTGELYGPIYKEKAIDSNGDFWQDMLSKTDFGNWLKEKFSFSGATDDTSTASEDTDPIPDELPDED